VDAIGRWGEKAFLILLPETELTSAKKVTEKINTIIKAKKLVHDDKSYRVSVKFGTVEYITSLEESLDRISSQINL
jgi:PleD family two-component response regulator